MGRMPLSPPDPAAAASMKSVSRLAVITSYFNPYGDQRVLHNYWRFKDALRKKCYSIELSYGRDFETDADIKVAGGDANIVWQKEALLNRLMCRLAEDYDAVAWVDADIVFEETAWEEIAVEALRAHETVQLFSMVDFLDERGGIQRRGASLGARNVFGTPAGVQCGLAWAARLDFLRRIGGLYARAVCGSNDVIFADAVCRRSTPTRSYVVDSGSHPDYKRSVSDWKRNVSTSMRAPGANLPGRILHLYHRNRANGRYKEACDMLKAHQYSPWRDVSLNGDGALEWTGCNSPLESDLRLWFESRSRAS